MARIPQGFVPKFAQRLDELVWDGKYDLWWENVLYNYLDRDDVSAVDVSDLFWGEVDYIEDYERILEYVRTGDVGCKTDRKFLPKGLR